MQYNMEINKLKKVIQMIIPKTRSALDFAAINSKDGSIMTAEHANIEANKLMEQWMSVPDLLPKISRI